MTEFDFVGAALDEARASCPLVHCITNCVTVNDCANALLAIGGSPIMSDEHRAWLRGRGLADCLREAVAGGVTFVQLREKNAAHDEVALLARELKAVCAEAGVPFVIDDDVALAAEVGADGVHVGQSDMACAEARRILGEDAIVGVSAQTVDEALAAQAAGADYLGVGALHPTPTKPDAVDVTMDELRRICGAVSIPVVGIGGVDAASAHELAGSVVAGGAAVSAIFAADDCRLASAELARGLAKVVSR